MRAGVVSLNEIRTGIKIRVESLRKAKPKRN